MNLKLENAHYTNVHGTVGNVRGNPKYFTVTITDLDGKLNNGKPFPYTYVDDGNDATSNVKQYIKSKLNELDIAYYNSDSVPELALNEYRYYAQHDIDDDCNTFIKSYDVIYFINDVFTYDMGSISVLNSIIECYKSQLDNGTVDKDTISHKFISATNYSHDLSYDQLVDLRNQMILRYSEIKLHARALKDRVNEANTIDEILNIRWDLWDL